MGATILWGLSHVKSPFLATKLSAMLCSPRHVTVPDVFAHVASPPMYFTEGHISLLGKVGTGAAEPLRIVACPIPRSILDGYKLILNSLLVWEYLRSPAKICYFLREGILMEFHEPKWAIP